MKKRDKHPILPHMTIIYICCSILAFPILFVSLDVAMLVYAPGASSGYITFLVATSDLTICKLLRIAAITWSLVGTAMFIASLSLTTKRQYRYLSLYMLADAIITIAWFVYCCISDDPYWVGIFGVDAWISPIYALIFTYFAWTNKDKKTEDDSLP